MTSLKINESNNDLSQPLIIPSSQEETKASDFDLSNNNLPKIPSQSLQNDPSIYESVNNKPFSNPSESDLQLVPKKTLSNSHKVPQLIKHNSAVKGDSHQKTIPFVLTQHLGPFIPPEGGEAINVERLMPYLDFVTELYENSFGNMSFKLYLVWLSIYPVLAIALLTLPFEYFESNWDAKHALKVLPIAALVIAYWLYTPYQAYKMHKIIKKKDKKGISWIIMLMTVFIMGGILMICVFELQDPADQDIQNIIAAYITALGAHILLTLIPAFGVKKAIVKFHRFIFLKNNLQDPEKTGIYYQYAFELLHMISEKGLLYPIKAPKSENNKGFPKEIIKTVVEGLEAAHLISE